MDSVPLGTPFYLKDVSSLQSVFTSVPTGVAVIGANRHTVEGYAMRSSRRLARLAACGEFNERYSFSVKPPGVEGYFLQGYNVIREEIVTVPLHAVYYSDAATLVPPGEERTRGADSLGAASHRTSRGALEAAWLEYVERQSLLYNWLTCSPGSRVSHEMLSPEIRQRVTRLNAYFDEVQIFDISLHPEVPVVLALGIGGVFMGEGAAAGWTLWQAVEAAINECTSRVLHYVPWDTGRQGLNLLPEEIGMERNLYVREFYKHYDPVTLRDAYRYLTEEWAHLDANGVERVPAREEEIVGVMRRVGEALNIEPIVVRVPSLRESDRAVKVLAFEGYPHMFCSTYDPEDYAISFHRGVNKFPNRRRMVPFA